MQGVAEIRRALDEKSFKINSGLSWKAPQIPIVLYGYVENNEQLAKLQSIVEPLKRIIQSTTALRW